MVQDIKVLTLSFRDYTNKLERVQKYSSALADACHAIKSVLSQPDENMLTHCQTLVSHIMDMLENFVVWFEFTYNSKLYEFTCVLLHSQLERPEFELFTHCHTQKRSLQRSLDGDDSAKGPFRGKDPSGGLTHNPKGCALPCDFRGHTIFHGPPHLPETMHPFDILHVQIWLVCCRWNLYKQTPQNTVWLTQNGC